MTHKQTIEAIRVMQAFVDGKEVESKLIVNHNWVLDKNPSWNWLNFDFRIKPTPVLRPWTADEVPLGAQLRSKGLEGRLLITLTGEQIDREWWLKASEHSTDGGKTWWPCGVEEESK